MKTSNQDQVRSLPANLVLISGHNTRHPTDKEVLDSGLVESIRNTGQLTPGLGRPHPGIPGAVELCAGARRSIACRILERNFDVIVREMSDKDFIDAILIENLQREDPDPEAEAELIRLRIAEGMTPSEIAAKYGKSELWVKRRVKLLQVIPKLRKLFAPGKDYSHYTTEMKERLGDLPAKVQEAILDHHEWELRRASKLADLMAIVERSSCSLKDVSWLDDPATAYKGCGPGCAESSKESLFKDAKDKCGSCLNRECFTKRRAIAHDLALEKALDGEPVANVVFYSQTWISEPTYKGKKIHVLDQWDFKGRFKVSKKKTEWIGINLTDQSAPKKVWLERIGKAGKTGGKGPGGAAQESREDKLTGKRLSVINDWLRDAIDKCHTNPAGADILELVAIFGISGSRTFCSSASDHAVWQNRGKAKLPHLSLMNSGEASPEDVIWESLKPVLKQRIQFHTNKDLLHPWKIGEMKNIAKLIGFDYDGEWTTICTKEIPVPKSWGVGFDPITLQPAVVTANVPGSGKSVLAKAVEKAKAKNATKQPAKKAPAKKKGK